MSDDPLAGLDGWIVGFALALVLVCALAHALFPRISPAEAKPGLASFVCASYILPRALDEKAPTLTPDGIPAWRGGEPSYSVEGFVEELEARWTPQSPLPLGKVLVAMSLKWFGLSQVLLGMAKLCEFFQPFFVHCLLAYMVSQTAGPLTSYKLMIAEVLQTLLSMVARQFSAFLIKARLAEPIVGALTLMVHRKVFKLSPEGSMRVSASQVQQVFGEGGEIYKVLTDSPLSGLCVNAAGVLFALWRLHGLAGTSPLICGLVVSVAVFACAAKVQAMGLTGLETLHHTHIARLEIVNHLLANFKTVRLADSVQAFVGPLDAMAAGLDGFIRRLGIFVGVGTHLVKFLNYLWVLIFYGFSVLVRGEKVVFEHGYLTYMFTVMLASNLMALLGGLQAWKTLHVKAFMLEAVLRLPERECASTEGPLEVSGANFAWPLPPKPEGGDSPGLQQVLTSVDFKPEAGELVLLCGSVGAGKSSFLLSLLGQTQRTAGTVRMPAGPVAFQGQEPFLLDATIRANVLMGVRDEECDEAALQRALEVSQLGADFGDPKSTLHVLRERTVTGKQGTNLSGGQRARSVLARTVYSVLQGAELAILDDPVAQVDNEVVETAWGAAVVQAMSRATRIIAVNSQLLGRVAHTADRLVLLKEGKIAYNGPPAGASSTELSEILGCEVELSPKMEGAATDGSKSSSCVASQHESVAEEVAKDATAGEGKIDESPKGLPVPNSKAPDKLEAVFSLFARTRSWLIPCSLPLVISSLSAWTTCWTVRQWELGLTRGYGDTGWWLFLAAQYVFFIICEAGAHIGFTHGMSTLALKLNQEITQTIRVLGMSYFWREGSDAELKVRRVCSLDARSFMNFAKVPIQVFVLVIHMIPQLMSAPLLVPLLVAVGPLLRRIVSIRTWIGRQLQPCEQTLAAKQGVMYLDAFAGAAVIRSMRREQHFDLACQTSIYAGLQLRHWGGAAFWHGELLTWVIRTAFVVGAIMAITRQRQLGREAWTAQVLYFNATVMSNFLGTLLGEYLNCAKLLEDHSLLESFLQNDCREPEGGEEPPEGWPSAGAISLEKVAFRYDPRAPPAVADLSVEIRPCEKVGVVGKTGSGKSTLVSLLFRLGPSEGYTSGRVCVDGVDLAPLRISALRRVVGLVPQEPAWFKCSLRHQVSVEHSDAEILAALERCGIDARQITRTSTSPEALAKEVAPSELSMGQKQLLMVARALVRRPKILILDESTAFLDGESADRLLAVISKQCEDSTVLSIAHRLRFVLESDRILVLSGGRVIAFDSPKKLLEDQDGYFATNLRLERLETEG